MTAIVQKEKTSMYRKFNAFECDFFEKLGKLLKNKLYTQREQS